MTKFVVATETFTLRTFFDTDLATVRTKAQALADALSENVVVHFADNFVINPLVENGVEPNDVKVERFSPAAIAPSIASLTPATGPAAGGTWVDVVGTRLRDGLAITFGGSAVPAADIEVQDTEHLRFKIPAHAAGAVSLNLANTDGTTISKPSAFTYT